MSFNQTSFYQKKQAKATQLLSKYGIPMPLYDGSKALLNTLVGISAQHGISDIEGESNLSNSLIKSDSRYFIVNWASGVQPTVDHYIEFDGDIFKIIIVQPIKIAAVGLLYELYCSNGA